MHSAHAGPWGIRIEDTVIVGPKRAEIVTVFGYGLTA
jgi:Xaa-Pro aminopeptidase